MSLPALGSPAYGITRSLRGTTTREAIERVTASLAGEGFGVLSTIDVQATLKAKLDKDIRGYTILGACSPGLAIQALSEDPGVGLLMPCNVVVAEEADGTVSVSAVDPVALLQVAQRPALEGLAMAVRGQLTRAIEAL